MPRALKPGHDFELSHESDAENKNGNSKHDDDFKAFLF